MRQFEEYSSSGFFMKYFPSQEVQLFSLEFPPYSQEAQVK